MDVVVFFLVPLQLLVVVPRLAFLLIPVLLLAFEVV